MAERHHNNIKPISINCTHFLSPAQYPCHSLTEFLRSSALASLSHKSDIVGGGDNCFVNLSSNRFGRGGCFLIKLSSPSPTDNSSSRGISNDVGGAACRSFECKCKAIELSVRCMVKISPFLTVQQFKFAQTQQLYSRIGRRLSSGSVLLVSSAAVTADWEALQPIFECFGNKKENLAPEL